jgi:cell division protein FtsI/penicillin-binding protein 2
MMNMNPRQTRQNVKKKKTGSKDNGYRRLNRVNIMRLFVVFLGILIVARLFYLQVIKHDYYVTMANQEHQKKFVVPAVRGSLYFRDGSEVVPAVLNSTVYTLYADPNEVNDPEKIANIVSSVLGLDRDLIMKLTKKSNTSYVVLAKRLSKYQVDELFKQKSKTCRCKCCFSATESVPRGFFGRTGARLCK